MTAMQQIIDYWEDVVSAFLEPFIDAYWEAEYRRVVEELGL